MADEEQLDTYLGANIIIDIVKAQHNIRKTNLEMTDEEVSKIMRFLGKGAPDTIWVDGHPNLGRTGLGVMLSLTLYEFPEFYVRWELWQVN